MAIFVAYSNSGVTSGKKFVATSKWRPFWKCQNIKHSFNLTSEMKRSSQIMQEKIFSLWWRHRWRHRVTSKSFLYISLWMKKITIFMTTEKRTNISSSNLVYICIIELLIRLYKRSWIASLMTSSGPKISQIFKLQYRSKAHNVTNAHGYLCNIFTFWYHFR